MWNSFSQKYHSIVTHELRYLFIYFKCSLKYGEVFNAGGFIGCTGIFFFFVKDHNITEHTLFSVLI